jgi:hypothetical protein
MIMSNVARHAALAATTLMIIGGSAASGAANSHAERLPTVDPSHGGKAQAWTVVTPMMVPISGPAPHQQPRCDASDVTANAVTRIIPGGVAGIVHLRGKHCSIWSKAGPDELRSGDATLAVNSTPWSKQKNPIDTFRSDLPRWAGKLIWSFTWTGSWCGDPPTSVVLPLAKGHGEVLAPYSGPAPGCHAGPTVTPSILTPGAPGWPGSQDQAPGAGWGSLTNSLSIPKKVHGSTIHHISVTFANPTDTDVPLAPCPTYGITEYGKRGGGVMGSLGLTLPCPYQARLVPAHGQVTIDLPPVDFWPDDVPERGGRLEVNFAIWGVPPAATHTHVAARG